jgi:hypothetical protein
MIEYTDCEQEVYAAVGELLVSKLDGQDDLARAIFEALVPKFINRYPHHKILTHIVLGKIKEESEEELETRLKAILNPLPNLLEKF